MQAEEDITSPLLGTAKELKDVNESSLTSKKGLSHLLNHLHMTFAFLTLFIAFSAVQNLATAFHGQTGNLSLTAIYICFCLSSLILAAPIVSFVGTKLSMVAGSVCYLAFIIANRWTEPIPIIFTGALLGVGASIIWAAQGAYLTIAARNYALANSQLSTSSMGLFTGIFFAIFQVVGNLISSILLDKYGKDIPTSAIVMLMYIYIGVASAGVLGFVLLRAEKKIDSQAEPTKSLSERLFHVFMVLKKPKMIFLIPVIFYSGLEQSFIFGIFTGEIIKPTLGDGRIGYVMAIFGAVDVVSSLCLGQLSDRYGPFLVVCTGIFCHTVVLIGLYTILQLVPISWFGDHSYLIYIIACLWAVGDAAFNLYPNTMMSLHFMTESEPAFSILKFFQSLAAALPFALSTIHLTLSFRVECVFGFLVFVVVALCYMEVFVDTRSPSTIND